MRFRCVFHTWQGGSYSAEQLKSENFQVILCRFYFYFHWIQITCLTLWPAFAEVSINITFSSLAFCSPSSVLTCRFSPKSVLFPTSIIITSLPRSVRTSSIHLDVCLNEFESLVIKVFLTYNFIFIAYFL